MRFKIFLRKNKRPINFSAVTFLFYAAFVMALFILLQPQKISVVEWANLMPAVQWIMLSVIAFTVAIGVLGGFLLKRAILSAAINTGGVLLSVLVLAAKPIFTRSETALLAILVAAGAFLLTIVVDLIVRTMRRMLKGEKFTEIYPWFHGKNRTLLFVIAGIIFFAAMIISFYLIAINDESKFTPLEITTVYIIVILPVFSIISGIFSGSLLDRFYVMPLINVIGTALFLVAIRADQLLLIGGATAVILVLTFAADRITASIRHKKERHAPPGSENKRDEY